MNEPRIERSLTLQFIGDWGQANFHRICGWLTQEFCDRAGPESRVATWSIRHGGIEAIEKVANGEVDLCVATPDYLMTQALTGEGIFAGRPMPDLRTIGVLPQNDAMVLAVDPKFGVRTFEDIRAKKPPLKIATSTDDGTNFIGHVAMRFMAAHGIDRETLESWGGGYIHRHRPEQSLMPVSNGLADAVLQEAIMTPWWMRVMTERQFVVIPAEPEAMDRITAETGLPRRTIPAGYWPGLNSPVETTDFGDFCIVVRSDMPDDVAHLLAWCLVETRGSIERNYRHLPPERSPLSYPLVPEKMARPAIPLHPGARAYYEAAGYLK